MPTITITRVFEFDAGHRVVSHLGKCRHLHGHRYKAEVTVSADSKMLDSLGMVTDFGDLKRMVGGWIDNHWDHTMILNPQDPLIEFLKSFRKEEEAFDIVFGGKDPFVMPECAANPTAENMAMVLHAVAVRMLRPDFIVEKVRLYETPNCWAECWVENNEITVPGLVVKGV